MKAALSPSLALLLLTSVFQACRPASDGPEAFEAWEEGRTLIFENPSLPDAPPARPRFHERYQKQVLRSVDSGGERRVDTQFTTFQGQSVVSLRLKDGGVSVVDPQGRPTLVLPEGFPDRTPSWRTTDHLMRVLGRARWDRDRPAFPSTRPAEGVWVEGEPLKGGVRTRFFVLPDFGEIEKREWRDGRWVTTNLLVGFSFQEIPRSKERE